MRHTRLRVNRSERPGACASSAHVQMEKFRLMIYDLFFNQQSPLGEDVLDDPAVHVRQAEIAAAVAVGQAFVVQAHQVQDRGV